MSTQNPGGRDGYHHSGQPQSATRSYPPSASYRDHDRDDRDRDYRGGFRDPRYILDLVSTNITGIEMHRLHEIHTNPLLVLGTHIAIPHAMHPRPTIQLTPLLHPHQLDLAMDMHPINQTSIVNPSLLPNRDLGNGLHRAQQLGQVGQAS